MTIYRKQPRLVRLGDLAQGASFRHAGRDYGRGPEVHCQGVGLYIAATRLDTFESDLMRPGTEVEPTDLVMASRGRLA